jgi:hypothetical protein
LTDEKLSLQIACTKNPKKQSGENVMNQNLSKKPIQGCQVVLSCNRDVNKLTSLEVAEK